MLKVEPYFKLGCPFRGQYRVHTVTCTCIHIKVINQLDAELITVTIQRLSQCRKQDISTVNLGLSMSGHVSNVRLGSARSKFQYSSQQHSVY